MTARSVSDLAADVESKVLNIKQRSALNKLVARLETAEAARDNWKASCARYLENRQAAEARLVKERLAHNATAETAEAQVSALTQERDARLTREEEAVLLHQRDTAEAALAEAERTRNNYALEVARYGAALAETRRALEQIAEHLECFEPANAHTVARRALAATGGGTGQEQQP